jgi:DNA-binding response OmpR family regulator
MNNPKSEMRNPHSKIIRILVVEDEPVICQVCLRILAGEGFEVDIAGNGGLAQGMLGKKDYDLVLIDIKTPVMNGKQLYQVIIAQHPKIVNRVIFTTGDVMDGYTRRFLELAGCPYLLKPFTIDELRDIVRETMRRVEK